MSDDEHSALFRVVFGIVETFAIVVGLALTIFSLMAIVGQFTANFWVQLTIGATAALLVPFLLADRLLPKGEKAARSRGRNRLGRNFRNRIAPETCARKTVQKQSP